MGPRRWRFPIGRQYDYSYGNTTKWEDSDRFRSRSPPSRFLTSRTPSPSSRPSRMENRKHRRPRPKSRAQRERMEQEFASNAGADRNTTPEPTTHHSVVHPFNNDGSVDYDPEDKFARAPPRNYICNRCHKPGHFLQKCPTNMDPAFDRAPGKDYFCTVCRETGVHYKSLCPFNRDPLSIVQKRKVLAREHSVDTKVASHGGEVKDRHIQTPQKFVSEDWSTRQPAQLEASEVNGRPFSHLTEDPFIETDTPSTVSSDFTLFIDAIDNSVGEPYARKEQKDFSPFVKRLVESRKTEMTSIVNNSQRRITVASVWIGEEPESDDEDTMPPAPPNTPTSGLNHSTSPRQTLGVGSIRDEPPPLMNQESGIRCEFVNEGRKEGDKTISIRARTSVDGRMWTNHYPGITVMAKDFQDRTGSALGSGMLGVQRHDLITLLEQTGSATYFAKNFHTGEEGRVRIRWVEMTDRDLDASLD